MSLAISIVVNKNRVLFPKTGFCIADLVRYYDDVSSALLPHLRGRPVSLRRFPGTVDDEAYWEKDAPAFTPRSIKTVPVPRASGGSDLHYIVIDGERALTWAASVGCIEIHPFLHCFPEINRPTSVVFDLDPGEGAGLIECCAAALQLREFFAEFALELFPKVSGLKGMQVYLPLNTPTPYAATHAFANRVAEKLSQKRPELIVFESTRGIRARRVLIDWAQNSQPKSNVAVYSLRASDEPRVSIPLGWNEINHALRSMNVAALQFGPEAAIDRIRGVGDIFAPVLTLRQELPQQLLREWKVISRPTNLISLNRPSRKSVEPAPRNSGQGGRKQFIAYSPTGNEQEIALRIGEELRTWKLVPPLEGVVADRHAIETNPTPAAKVRSPGLQVWDEGTYELIEGSYTTGSMRMYFSGKRFKGEWLLARQNNEWTFRKEPGASDLPQKRERARERSNSLLLVSNQRSVAPGRLDLKLLPLGEPRFVEPMEADEVDRPEELPTNRAEWLYEIKWDGYRAIAVKRNGAVRIYGRSGKPLENCRHEHLDRALAESNFADGVLDGEIVAFQNGVASFQTLQNSLRNDAPVVFVAFDVLNYDGRDLTPLSYVERRALLSRLQPLLPPLFPISEPIDADVSGLLKTFEQKKIEGLVAKRRDAYYRAGKTSHGWVKYWIGELGEFVIGGYMPGKDRYFEALAVGEYVGGKLIYREQIRHGFSLADKQSVLAAIRGNEIPECPFQNLPQKKRRGAVDEIRMDKYVWVRPKLRCLMRYKERTAAGEIREHGKFVRLLEAEAA